MTWAGRHLSFLHLVHVGLPSFYVEQSSELHPIMKHSPLSSIPGKDPLKTSYSEKDFPIKHLRALAIKTRWPSSK